MFNNFKLSLNPQLSLESANSKWNPRIISEFRKLSAESANCMPNPHKIVESTFTCGTRLHLGNPEQRPILARCGIRNKINVPTKLALQIFVRGMH